LLAAPCLRLQQAIDGHAEIHPLPRPARHTRSRGDVHAARDVDCIDRRLRLGCVRYVGDQHAFRREEQQPAIVTALEGIAAFMHQPMVMSAEQHQVIRARLSTIGPVADVMRIDMVMLGAARKPAAAITMIEEAADGRRDGAGLAPDVQRFAVGVFVEFYRARIAGETAGGVGREGGAVIEIAAAVVTAFAQGGAIDVDDDGMAIGRTGCRVAVSGQEALGEQAVRGTVYLSRTQISSPKLDLPIREISKLSPEPSISSLKYYGDFTYRRVQISGPISFTRHSYTLRRRCRGNHRPPETTQAIVWSAR
jgi:hypothetical protein